MERPGQPNETAAWAFLRLLGKRYREFAKKMFQYSYNYSEKVDGEIIVR